MKIKIKSLHFQRNGVGGENFYACYFSMKDGKSFPNMLATFQTTTLDDTDIIRSSCRVVNLNDINSSWRGDEISDAIENECGLLCKKMKEKQEGNFTIYDLTENNKAKTNNTGKG